MHIDSKSFILVLVRQQRKGCKRIKFSGGEKYGWLEVFIIHGYDSATCLMLRFLSDSEPANLMRNLFSH